MAGNLWLRGGAAADAPVAPAPTLRPKPTPAPASDEPATASRMRRLVARPELLGLLALAAILNLWSLDANGWANTYYSAAVRSMTESWHAFIYGSFDVGGVMTVDKPPLALWVQALSARAFGLDSWSILVPQALMGVAAVGLTYDLTRRRFGRAGGFVAGLALAITPVAVAVFRHNNPDALLVLCSVGALWAIVRALEDGRTRWLVLAGACVGLGLRDEDGRGAPRGAGDRRRVPLGGAARLLTAIRQLLAGGAAMLVVGLAWPRARVAHAGVDRPYVSGTDDNSDLVAHPRLQRPRARVRPERRARRHAGGWRRWRRRRSSAARPGRCACSTRRSAARPRGCSASPLVGGWASSPRPGCGAPTRRTGWLIATGGVVRSRSAIAFSYASGIFHPYYVSLLAPFTAALAGGAAVALMEGGIDRAGRRRRWPSRPA